MLQNKPYLISSGPKQQAREEIAYYAYNLNLGKVFLTLPAEQALCCLTLRNTFPNIITIGLESDNEVFNNIDTNLVDIPINRSIEDFNKNVANKPFGKHPDVAFLDYLGAPDFERILEVASLIGNKNLFRDNKETILALTFQKSNRTKKNETEKDMYNVLHRNPWNDVSNNLNDIDSYIKAKIDDVRVLEKLELLNSWEYRATESSTPMYFFIYHLKF